MSKQTGLQQVAANLQYAATAGAERLAHQVVADGKVQAEVGQAVHTPGPGLSALVGPSRAARAHADLHMDLPPVVHHMAEELAAGGARLAGGQR